MAVMQAAQQLKRQVIEVVDLGGVEPAFPTPRSIKQAGIDATESDSR